MSFFRPFAPLLKGWAISFLGFGFLTAAMSIQFLSATQAPLGHALRSSARDWLPWIVLTPLLFRFVSRFPVNRRNRRSRVPLHLAIGIAVLALCSWWEGIADPGFQPAPKPGGPGLKGLEAQQGGLPWLKPPPPPAAAGLRPFPRLPDFIRIGSFQLPLLLMVMSAAHAARFYRRDRDRAVSLARARLDLLTMQLQPHFLFNTLNMIAELVHEDPHRADQMITALSDMLRLTLDAHTTHLVPLQRETDFVERYFAILQTRFGERLHYDCDLDAQARTALVPPFLLQPLVENAVRHGIGPRVEGGRVGIQAAVTEGVVHIFVRDDGLGLTLGEHKREGLGLKNTRERLEQLFGDEASVTLRNGRGVEVELILPFQPA